MALWDRIVSLFRSTPAPRPPRPHVEDGGRGGLLMFMKRLALSIIPAFLLATAG